MRALIPLTQLLLHFMEKSLGNYSIMAVALSHQALVARHFSHVKRVGEYLVNII